MRNRSELTIQSAVGARLMVEGRSYINFGGSSYLGLAAQPQIIEAGVAALREYGPGPSLARDQGMVTRFHQEAEMQAAAFFGTEGAQYLASGYLFGLTTLAAMKQQFGAIFVDDSSHHSLRESIAASGLRTYFFRHLDAEDLRAQLQRHLLPSEKPLIVTDGMFAVLGEIAPLDLLWKVVAPYDGQLLVDESHSFGVLGPTGRGAVSQYDIPASRVVFGGSLAKAFGTCGGIIPATQKQISTYRATPAGAGASAGPPAAAAMCAASLQFVHEHPELLEQLRENIRYMKRGLGGLGLNITQSITPVASFSLGEGKSMQWLQTQLFADGIFVYYTNYVGAGSVGVIRCGIFADHTQEQIDALLDALRRLL